MLIPGFLKKQVFFKGRGAPKKVGKLLGLLARLGRKLL
jgi:hypothetical protein